MFPAAPCAGRMGVVETSPWPPNPGERKLLKILIAAHPESLGRVELARQSGYSNAKSGGFAAPMARLIELGFVEAVGSGVVRGSDMLFLKRRKRNGKGDNNVYLGA